jgi:hypothetical protein
MNLEFYADFKCTRAALNSLETKGSKGQEPNFLTNLINKIWKTIFGSETRPPKELKGWKKLDALLNENENSSSTGFIEPTRRVCNFGGMESQEEFIGLKDEAEKAIFVTDDEKVRVRPMKFLRKSPFAERPINRNRDLLECVNEDSSLWKSTFDILEKQLQAIAKTADGKHVILQQTPTSCSPTCVAMLVLDHGKVPNYEAISTTNLANTLDAINWFTEAGLKTIRTELSDKNNITADLVKLLKENGPGILTLNHPDIGNHSVVLDRISTEDNEAIIRDPFHGWMITVKLDVLISWVEDHRSPNFLQVKGES